MRLEQLLTLLRCDSKVTIADFVRFLEVARFRQRLGNDELGIIITDFSVNPFHFLSLLFSDQLATLLVPDLFLSIDT